MKKIMLAAVAASFVSTGASAVQLPAEGEACSSIHSNISVGINNPELSDYRKCVMIQHEIDTAFTYKTFWVRTGTEFTSFPVETLAKMNRGERIDYIKLAIQRGIALEALTAERDALIVERDVIIGKLADGGFDSVDAALLALSSANSRISELETIETQLNGKLDDLKLDIKHVTKLKKTNEARVAELETRVSTLETALANAQAAAGTKYMQGYRESLEETLRVFKEELGGTIAIPSYVNRSDVGNGHLFRIVRTAINDARNYINVAKQAAHTSSRVSDERRDFSKMPVSADDRRSVPTETISIESEAAVGTYHAPIMAIEYTVTVGDDTFNVTLTGIDSISWSSIIEAGFDSGFAAGYEKGFEAGYTRGFDHGFEDGYNEGYADGFTDGVNSVK